MVKQYIGLLSIIYILVIIVKLKDNQKSFEHYIEEYKQIKFQLNLISQRKNPFIVMKFSHTVFYSLLLLYYIANLLIFSYTIIDVFSYLLILFTIIKLSKKISINSINDFENRIKFKKKEYHKQQKLKFYLGLFEFAYAFNALVLISFYY